MKGERRPHARFALSAILAAVVLAAITLGASAAAAPQVATTKLRATLDARQVAPKQDVGVPNATGLFTATLTGKKLSWTLTYRGLSGPALGAHIHIAKRRVAKFEPVIGLCGFLADANQPADCKSGVHGTAVVHDGTLYTISASAVRKAILSGGAYVNVHTTKNYNWGEIRGQIAVVK